jgi:shikimate dehydrogenase
MGIPYAEVIGDPIAHSKSPLIHDFWLEKLGLEGTFRALRVKPDELSGYLAARRFDPDWRGCNVTLPHKENILPLLAQVECSEVGAVNCVHPREGELVGHNTDVEGVLFSLGDEFGVQRLEQPVAIIGAGGAARAAVMALRQLADTKFVIVTRTKARGEQLLTSLNAIGTVYPLEGAEEALQGCIALINASPLGMAGAAPMPEEVLSSLDLLHSDAVVLDMVYSPLETSLLRKAREASFDVVDGAMMLVGQARASFSLFFSVTPSDALTLAAADLV